MFDPLWTQRLNTFRRILAENLGVRDFRGIASWGVACFAAYWLWVRPSWKEKAEIQVKINRLTGKDAVLLFRLPVNWRVSKRLRDGIRDGSGI